MQIVLRALAVFIVLYLITRVIGKRQLGQMTAFELVLLITMGDLIQQGVTQEDQSITGAMLAVSTFGFWITILTWATWRSKRVRTAVEGTPIVLVQDGQPIDAALRLEQMPLDEILEAARNKGISDLSEVKWAILEVSGKISIIKADAAAKPDP